MKRIKAKRIKVQTLNELQDMGYVVAISSDAIKVSSDIQYLTGQGTEYLTDDMGNVLIKFQDGNIVRDWTPVPSNDETK